MNGERLIQWAVSRPRSVTLIMLALTAILAAGAVIPTFVELPLPPITVDVDPENMLDAGEPVRVHHNESKKLFALHDSVVLGVINEHHEKGVYNPSTLGKLHALTAHAKSLEGVVASEVLSFSTVDSIENRGAGTVVFDWLMKDPPANQAEADLVRTRAARIPFLKDTLFSADGKAAVVYIPLEKKSYAHDVSVALQEQIAELGAGDDEFHIAGLPVAEETFGIEMFVQMAISAPVAMVVIFLLMWVFFRRLVVIVSPMIVAMVSVMMTMGLLIITGNTIHIMSSMIPIFIMPIAVLDAVHIISDFFDRYSPELDRRELILSVMRHLFTPMLFTSLTTAAGFASLALTPIPPVRVFGLFVALGVFLAWLWTILFVPAFLMSLSDARLAGFGRKSRTLAGDTASGGFLARLSVLTYTRAKLVLVAAVVITAGAGYGITKITINDNPTRWFESDHAIRIADRELNKHFGGTYDAFLHFRYDAPEYSAGAFAKDATQKAKTYREAIVAKLDLLTASIALQPDRGDPLAVVDTLDAQFRADRTGASGPERAGADAALAVLAQAFEEFDTEAAEQGGDYVVSGIRAQLSEKTREAKGEIRDQFDALENQVEKIASSAPKTAKDFVEALADLTDPGSSAEALVLSLGQAGQAFKDPALLAYLEGVQNHLATNPIVGKSSSVADIVKTVHRDLTTGADEDYRIPESARMVAQTLDQYLSSHRKDDLWHFVTPDFQEAVLWLQLTSGDNQDMASVVADAEAFLAANPAPLALEKPRWFGLTYINVIWQEKMVSGMLDAFLGSFGVVLIMMMMLFRSVLWGILSMIPLAATVTIIYGLLGYLGKDYDMPVAVLSSLSLGLAIDYAIHFLARSRDLQRTEGSWARARLAVFGEPARAISRNIVVVGFGFLPLLLAPLVPYQTVGALIAAILLLAGAMSLLVLPAAITVLRGVLFKNDAAPTSGAPS